MEASSWEQAFRDSNAKWEVFWRGGYTPEGVHVVGKKEEHFKEVQKWKDENHELKLLKASCGWCSGWKGGSKGGGASGGKGGRKGGKPQ